MSETKILADSDSVDLSEFTSIEDAAAQVLAKHKGDLWIGGEAEMAVDRARKCLTKGKK